MDLRRLLRRGPVVAVVASTLAVATLWLPGVSTAAEDRFCSTTGVNANSRCVGTRNRYLNGVGAIGYLSGTWYVCAGAKANSDGSGGNVVPFSCGYVDASTDIWTPGGSYGYGWPTLINNNPYHITAYGKFHYSP